MLYRRQPEHLRPRLFNDTDELFDQQIRVAALHYAPDVTGLTFYKARDLLADWDYTWHDGFSDVVPSGCITNMQPFGGWFYDPAVTGFLLGRSLGPNPGGGG